MIARITRVDAERADGRVDVEFVLADGGDDVGVPQVVSLAPEGASEKAVRDAVRDAARAYRDRLADTETARGLVDATVRL